MKLNISNAYKCLQRRYYDVSSSNKSTSCLIFFVVLIILLLIFNITEIWLWYEKNQFYKSTFSATNIGGGAWDHKLCLVGPIDVVYTWVNGSDPVFLEEMEQALKNVKDSSVYNDSTPARYRDKEELRYSLRSLEKFAPWVRHVFIITNGQIPYWLDLDSPKMTLVTHEDIFTDESHLPTFSSPAIEAHLHRIPGLSELFIYFNDDIILGKEIYPEDFVTISKGYKVFLSWNIPDCSSECPWAWVGDGSCDPPCNIERCAYDNGDCVKKSTVLYPKIMMNPTMAPIVKEGINSSQEVLKELEKVEGAYRDLKKRGKNIGASHELGGKFKVVPSGNGNYTFEKKQNETVIEIKENLDLIGVDHQNLGRKILSSVIINNTLEIKQMLSKLKPAMPKIIDLLKSQNISHAVKLTNENYLEEKRRLKRNRRRKQQKTENLVIKINPDNVIGGNGMALMAVNQSALSIRLADKPDWSEVNVSTNRKEEKHLDMFGESLLFVHKLYNKEFGLRSRKVPAHMPHLFNKTIMVQLQERFAEEWKLTSRHQFRHASDMQLAFSYFHFLLSLANNRSVDDIFDEFDTDQSGTWSDREIRTVLTRLYGTPLTLPAVLEFETAIKNCSKKVDSSVLGTPAPYDRYIDSDLPTVSRDLLKSCAELVEAFQEEFPTKKVFKTEIIYDKQQDGLFKGLVNNLSMVLDTLDFIRANQRKFICINDNIQSKTQDSDEEMILAVLHDFYQSLYPHISQFELPANTRNRFLHVNEYLAWKNGRQRNILWIFFAFSSAVFVTFYVIFQSEIQNWIRFKCRNGANATAERKLSSSIYQI